MIYVGASEASSQKGRNLVKSYNGVGEDYRRGDWTVTFLFPEYCKYQVNLILQVLNNINLKYIFYY